jgi:tetratricopeptide (TPR) repeat protein
MTPGREEHLSGSDLERLMAPDPESVPATVREHLMACTACRDRLLRHVSHGEGLKLLAMRSIGPGPDCYSEHSWKEFASAVLPDKQAGAMLQHAAHCDICGQALKSALEECEDDAREGISETVPADPAFAPRMAARLLSRPRVRSDRLKASGLGFRWAWVAAGLALVIASSAYWLVRDRDPGTMVAQAAAENRMLPIRIPDAPYAPTRAERSVETGTSAALAEAEAAVLRKLERDPDNAEWLRYRSRVEILRGRYRAAVSILSPAADDPKSRASVLLDLATAWLAQGLGSQRPDELQRALGYLSEALEHDPANLVARFNRAVAAERLSLLDSAETDWNVYLARDSSSGWAAEARTSLARIRQKKTAGANP